jgi:hypothetical protein
LGVLGCVVGLLLLVAISIAVMVLIVSGFIKKTMRIHPGGIVYHSGKKLKFESSWENITSVSTTPGGRYSTASISIGRKYGAGVDISSYDMDSNKLYDMFKIMKDYIWYHNIELHNGGGW